jgi:hypothetical protein
MRSFLTSKDMFGHTVTLNFNKKGDSHKTLAGGIFSIFVRCIMIAYVYILLKRLILKEKNTIGEEHWLLDDIDPSFSKISFDQTGLGIYAYFLDQYGRVMEYNDNFKKHFKVVF